MATSAISSSPQPAMASTEAKKQTMVTVEAMDQPGRHLSDESLSVNIPWQTGFKERFPWSAFGALIIMMLNIMASVLVLKFSDEQAASVWCGGKIAPNVLLSIFNNFTNLAITFAVGNGIAIAWWRRALSGCTVNELHYSWSFSTSVTRVFIGLRYFNIIALAALATKLSVIDAALFQKSLDTYIGYANSTALNNLTAFASTRFPPTGNFGHTINQPGYMNWTAFPWYDWEKFNGAVLTNLLTKCVAETCTFGLPAAGFAVDCTDSTSRIDWGLSAKTAMSLNQSAGYQNVTIASTHWWLDFGVDTKGYSSIMLNLTWPSADMNLEMSWNDDEGIYYSFLPPPPANGSCPGNLTTRTCEFRPAVLNYTMVVKNQHSETKSDRDKGKSSSDNKHGTDVRSAYSTSIVPLEAFSQLSYSCDWDNEGWCGFYNSTWRQIAGVGVLHNNDIVEPFVPGGESTLEGFLEVFKSYLDMKVLATYDGSVWSTEQSGALAPFVQSDSSLGDGFCDFYYSDMTEQIVSQVNMLAVSISANPYAYYESNTDPESLLLKLSEDINTRYGNASAADYEYAYDKAYKRLLSRMSEFQWYNATFNLTNPLYGIELSDLSFSEISARVRYKDIFYKTQWEYAYGALAATAVVILSIFPLYYGFWQLGRQVTLGPFEIANAFQSPTFAAGSAAAGHAREVLRAAGETKVQYGEVVDEHGRRFVFHQVA